MEVGPDWESFTGLNDYDYDDIYQLTAVDSPEFSSYSDTDFTYDSMGNRLVVFSGQTENYSSNNLNQYSSVGGESYSYDLNGNLTDDGVQTYYYDFENRMTKVIRNSDGQTLAEHRYDPFGRRAKKITNNGSTVVNYLYDGPQVIEERDGNWSLQARYIYGYGIDEPLLLQKNGNNYFYQRDGLGTITEIVDSSGDVVEHYRYSAYGKFKIYDSSWNELSQSSVGNPYFFTARRFDSESGLYYYRARMYSAEIGRFLQVDPIGYWDSFNLYGYVTNNPVNLVDPLGLGLLSFIRQLIKVDKKIQIQNKIREIQKELEKEGKGTSIEYIATMELFDAVRKESISEIGKLALEGASITGISLPLKPTLIMELKDLVKQYIAEKRSNKKGSLCDEE